jgi:hypothetical protein
METTNLFFVRLQWKEEDAAALLRTDCCGRSGVPELDIHL